MKWYLALNEGGTSGDIAIHTKLAVLSARKNTSLKPHLLYIGNRNKFTEWMEEHGVSIIDSKLPYFQTIKDLVDQKKYSLDTLGHWLRTNVCIEETRDDYVFYTDVDVLFTRAPDLDAIRPRYFAAAPEFHRDAWNYFNAGVMVANVPGLREEYPQFEEYLRRNIQEKTYGFHDQIAYNQFYRRRWDRLPVELNWKPYWGWNAQAPLIHFHGPKVGAISAIIEGRWNWSSGHGRQIGSLFAAHLDDYERSLRLCLEQAEGLPPEDRAFIERIVAGIPGCQDKIPQESVNLSFTDFRMFPDD